ncbi:hypothetical protein CDAR_94911 [Caerostris darwini]|uniref:Uncharacterized protein n=1 Tax=Caerostris darwini TaxID=1538125 RepID=A0AAV4PML2_9ARAC|nr:hypothetical protein CDAR_94911 [Caerostris darwini]
MKYPASLIPAGEHASFEKEAIVVCHSSGLPGFNNNDTEDVVSDAANKSVPSMNGGGSVRRCFRKCSGAVQEPTMREEWRWQNVSVTPSRDDTHQDQGGHNGHVSSGPAIVRAF